MADLLPKTARKADAPVTRQEARARSERVGLAAFNASMARQGAQKAETAPGPTSHLSAYGGLTTAKEAKPSTVAKKAAPDLPASVAAIAHRLSDDSAKLLGAIVRRHEATGEAVTFDVLDAANVLGSTVARARTIRDSLVSMGFLIERTNRMGGPAGFSPVLTA